MFYLKHKSTENKFWLNMTKIKPKENKEKKPVVNQVYQGKFMRENESLWSKFFFSFAKPILDSSIEQEICFE